MSEGNSHRVTDDRDPLAPIRKKRPWVAPVLVHESPLIRDTEINTQGRVKDPTEEPDVDFGPNS